MRLWGLLLLLLLWLLLAGKRIPELGGVEEGVDAVDEGLEERTWKNKKKTVDFFPLPLLEGCLKIFTTQVKCKYNK